MATARQATRAAQMHAEDLSAYPNVVAIGTRRVDDHTPAAKKGTEADHAVAVYVSRKVPAEQLDAQERLPAYVEVPEPGGTERVPVVVVESGVIEPEGFTSE
jgi:hypothetical protein